MSLDILKGYLYQSMGTAAAATVWKSTSDFVSVFPSF